MKLSKGWIALIVVAAIVLIMILWVAGSYNGLVKTDESVGQKWANVESSYQRRMDLIPNLVNTVQGAVDFEKETQTQIAAVRTGAVAASDAIKNAKTVEEGMAAIQQSNQVWSSFGGLNINVERYPELKATENFLSLQDELAGTENRINFARNEYNTAVRAYNIRVRRFPTNIIAGMFGFETKTPFEADEGAEVAPTVSFD